MPLLAILGPLGFNEVVFVLVVGLLLFGRKLPEVGRQVGHTVANLRRGLQGFKDELNRDTDFREAREAFDDMRRGIRETRSMADPRRLLDSTRRDLENDVRGAGGDNGRESAMLENLTEPGRSTPPNG